MFIFMRLVATVLLVSNAISLALEFDDTSNHRIPPRVHNIPAVRAVSRPYTPDVIIGYYVGCGVEKLRSDIHNTRCGRGLTLSSTSTKLEKEDLPNMPCKPADQQFCQLTTDKRIWNHMAKLSMDIKDKMKIRHDFYFPFAFDAAPMVQVRNQRFIPSHLLDVTFGYTGESYKIDEDGLTMHIGNDGKVRRGDFPIVSVTCQSKKFDSAMWYDPNRESFDRATALLRRRVFVLGSLNGDMDHAFNLLKMVNLIDKDLNWIGDTDTVLVQTGNLIGDGLDSEELVRFFFKWTKQANEKGGRIVQLLGVNEIKWLAKRLDYAVKKDRRFDTLIIDNNRVSKKGEEIDVRLLSLPIAQRVGDTAFVHGGISPFYGLRDIKLINEYAKSEFPSYILARKAKKVKDTSMYSYAGPVLYDFYTRYQDEKRTCQVLEQTLRFLNVKRMVVSDTTGHKGEIFTRCQGRYFAMNSDPPKAKKQNQGILRILPDGTVSSLYLHSWSTYVNDVKRKRKLSLF
ncbi:hypothetical protein BDF22DRAFT_689519 [Syncephalis plumigaleata]|nr:hypothetical protein BDF22DRAFT_689519 [Syncephalis plumigaleata]